MESTGKRSLRTSTRLALFVSILLIFVPAVGSADLVVVPNAQETVEGDTSNSFPFGCATAPPPSQRYQQVYLASEVGSGTITQFAIRQDGAGAAFGPTLIPGVTITLSSTSNGPDTLSTTFANNVGADVTTVFSGGLTLSSAASADVPRPFDIVIPLQTPFYFDAAAGTNLLLDVTIPTCPTTTFFDVESTSGDSVSRVFSTTNSAAATGTANTLGLVTQFTITPMSVSPGQIGDALIFALWDVNNLNTLIAIESFTSRTILHQVRFRDQAGNNAREFSLCLPPFSTWTAAVSSNGLVTRVVSANTLLVNGSATPLDTILDGNPTLGFIEVIGLRQAVDPAVCANPALGEDVGNQALMGRAYYVNPLQSPVLAYGANALALKDFGMTKLTSSATVLGNKGVADALIQQGTESPSSLNSTIFGSRYFVAPTFGALTRFATTTPTGPTSGSCPRCKVPASFTFVPVSEPGATLPSFARSTSGNLVNVFDVTNTDIPGSTSGVLVFFETPAVSTSIPVTGFVVQTTLSPPPGQPFFNVLFPLSIK